jgi:alkylated DNA repair dioxygenase AlkB
MYPFPAWKCGLQITPTRIRVERTSPSLRSPTLLKLKAEIEAAAGSKCNSVLVNRYENEKDSGGWHADNEPEMSHEHPFASLRLGATRSFEMRKGKGPVQTIELEHGSLLVMGPGMQREWRHQVSKAKNPCASA